MIKKGSLVKEIQLLFLIECNWLVYQKNECFLMLYKSCTWLHSDQELGENGKANININPHLTPCAKASCHCLKFQSHLFAVKKERLKNLVFFAWHLQKHILDMIVMPLNMLMLERVAGSHKIWLKYKVSINQYIL